MTLPLSGERSLAALYFRSADRLRAAGCANALGRESLSVLMQCEREALLDHYCNMVLDELRGSHPDVRVEAYFPESTESLMARFNEILARHSVQDALKPGRSDAPLRIWVVHDAARVAGAEIQLLARLIHNFPGANVRALLLVPQAAADSASSSTFMAFGRRLLRWDIDLPSPAQVDATLDAARFDDREPAVRQLLRLCGLLPVAAAPQAAASLPLQPEATPASIDKTTTADRPTPSPTAQWHRGLVAQLRGWTPRLPGRKRASIESAAPPGVPSQRKGLTRIPEKAQGALVVSGVLLASSTLAMYWLQPEAFDRAVRAQTRATAPVAAAQPVGGSGAGVAPAAATTPPLRTGSGAPPWWRAREGAASGKTP